MTPDVRTAERLLKAGGFSRRQARAILSGGWKAMETARAHPAPSPVSAAQVDEMRRLLDEMRSTLGPGEDMPAEGR